MLQLMDQGTISSKLAKKVFKEILATGKDPKRLSKRKAGCKSADENRLRDEVKKALEANPQSVTDYRNGKDRALGYLVGQVMKQQKVKQIHNWSIN